MLGRALRHPLAWLLLLSLALHVGALLVLRDTLDFTQAGREIHGSEAYEAYARNLMATGVFGREAGIPDASIPPVYPYVLYVAYSLLGATYATFGLLHTLMDLLSLALLYDIARRLFSAWDAGLWGRPAGEWVAIGAGLFTVGYPYLLFQNLTAIDTPLWMLLLHLYVWLMVLLREQTTLTRRTWLISIAGGFALGLATLTRPITPVLAVLLALWFLFRLPLWTSVLRLVPVAALTGLCLLAWAARNWGVYEAFVPMTTTSGSNLWQGNNERTQAVFVAGYDVQWLEPPIRRDDPRFNGDLRLLDREFYNLALAYLSQNSADIPALMWTKFLVHWSIEIAPRYNPQPNDRWSFADDGRLVVSNEGADLVGVTGANAAYNQGGLMDTLGRPLHTLYFGALLLLACAGIVFSLRHWREASLIVLVQLSMTITYMLFHPSTRYRAPSDPLLFVLAAYALVWLALWWQQRRRATR